MVGPTYNQFHFHSAQCQSVLIAKTFTLQPKGKWHNTLSLWYICNDFIWRITPDTRDYFQCIYKTSMLASRAETWRRWAVCCIFKQPFIYSSNRDPLYIYATPQIEILPHVGTPPPTFQTDCLLVGRKVSLPTGESPQPCFLSSPLHEFDTGQK